MDKRWSIELKTYDPARRQGIEPVYTVGNGFLCARGYFEEEPEGLLSYGGTYINDVFGPARYTPWKGKGRELANTPNLFALRILANGEAVTVDPERTEEVELTLEMETPRYLRRYLWRDKQGNRLSLAFERFVSGADLHLAGQKLTLTALDAPMDLKVSMGIQPDVKNLNLVSSEPLPVQPGVRHLKPAYHDAEVTVSRIEGYKETCIAQGQRIEGAGNWEKEDRSGGGCWQCCDLHLEPGKPWEASKVIWTFVGKAGEDPLAVLREAMKAPVSYAEALQAHAAAWKEKWADVDLRIDGPEEDQAAIRYNILQLIQSCPSYTDRSSIGARGLTGEMYEGCIFWDTEIFMLPFFTFSDPKAAASLLRFRTHTLPEARAHAKSNYFEGAMFGWQVSEDGVEQTPPGVGAYYSIHVIADIAYAVLEYWNATHDEEFLLNGGAEIVLETARFWGSRVHRNPVTGKDEILAVRGPNEYDVIVNNNLYTNMMAQENLRLAAEVAELLASAYPRQWEKLQTSLALTGKEMERWKQIEENLVLPYDPQRDLYEEDDRYFTRVPLDLKKMKTSLKRVIDTTLPYEALSLYQITKQADVLHVMKNLHWRFTPQQMRNAWEYYVPKTCFDSSLSYSMHAVMACRLGMGDTAYRYYDVCSNFDVRDMQLNTISGLHFANFGGTWQAAVFGFAGVNVDPERMALNPCLPKSWKQIELSLWYRGSHLALTLSNDRIRVKRRNTGGPVQLELFGKRVIFEQTELAMTREEAAHETV